MINYFIPQGSNTDLRINSVKKHIKCTDCKHMKMDISKLNAMEASKIAILCSTTHYLKYPQGTVDCIVKSKSIVDLIKPLILKNMKFKVK